MGTDQEHVGPKQRRHRERHRIPQAQPIALPIHGHSGTPPESVDVAPDGWLGRTIREIDPEHQNVVAGVNFGRGLPRALHCKGVPSGIRRQSSHVRVNARHRQ